MATSLPARMVAEVEALGQTLVAWATAHPDATLAEHEAGVLAAVRTALPRLLGLVVEQSTRALAAVPTPRWPRCPGCTRRTPPHSWRSRQVRTTCGVVQLVRPYYVCAACHCGFSPVDVTLALAPRAHISAALRAWLVALGATTSFRHAATLLADLTGLCVSAETLRQHTEEVGQAVEAAQQAAIAHTQATQAPPAPEEPAPGMLVVETDGVMVRFLDGWHEVKVGLVAGQEHGSLVAPSYVAAREGPAHFGPRLLTEAARRGALTIVGWAGPLTGRGLAHLRPVVVLGDGAAWIWNLAADHFGAAIEVVDYYHATEHIWTVARALHSTETTAAAWAQPLCRALLAEGPTPLLAAFTAAQPATAEAREVLRRERGYFQTHAARMDYPAFRAAGLPIGSGAVESSARHLVQQRLKRAGCRWSEVGAQAVLSLCAQRASHRLAAA